MGSILLGVRIVGAQTPQVFETHVGACHSIAIGIVEATIAACDVGKTSLYPFLKALILLSFESAISTVISSGARNLRRLPKEDLLGKGHSRPLTSFGVTAEQSCSETGPTDALHRESFQGIRQRSLWVS